MTEAPKGIVAAGYDAAFGASADSPTLRRLWRELALGGDFPEDFLHISFVTLDQHRRTTRELRVGPGDTLADLGCGMAGLAGGPRDRRQPHRRRLLGHGVGRFKSKGAPRTL